MWTQASGDFELRFPILNFTFPPPFFFSFLSLTLKIRKEGESRRVVSYRIGEIGIGRYLELSWDFFYLTPCPWAWTIESALESGSTGSRIGIC